MSQKIKKRNVLLLFFLLILVSCRTKGQWTHSERSTNLIERIEQGLTPPIVTEDKKQKLYSIQERMEYYGVPGVSIALIQEGHIKHAKGYGVRVAGSKDSVTTLTTFQAASISKPVTALAALRLVDRSLIDLDSDTNHWLRTWKVPDSRFTLEQPVTLRLLLSHNAGINVCCFSGYESGANTPSTKGILEGVGNTDPIQVDTLPGSIFRYSGGGYTIVQMLIEDITGKPFPEALKDLVLDSLGMYQSTFSQSLSHDRKQEAAYAHQTSDEPIKGNWHLYPEQAAAGLWTTPKDLARYMIGVSQAYLGEDSSILSSSLAKEMLSVQIGEYGLGPGLGGSGETLVFAHSGGNVGFKAFSAMYPERGEGLVVMTNAENGDKLYAEIVRSVALEFDWPHFKPRIRKRAEIPYRIIELLAGQYCTPSSTNPTAIIEQEKGELFITIPNSEAIDRNRLIPISESTFFIWGTATTVKFLAEEKKLVIDGIGETFICDK